MPLVRLNSFEASQEIKSKVAASSSSDRSSSQGMWLTILRGLRGVGPVKAYELLADCTSEREVFDSVKRHYEEVAGDDWKKLLTEQCGLCSGLFENVTPTEL